ncbi:hypothetical protein MTO96_030667 [Rhipicephalus appendiculatus]
MNVRLHANQPVSRLVEQLRDVGGPLAVNELDLTNCICVDGEQLAAHIRQCKELQNLRCAACPVAPADVLRFVTQHLPNLVEVEFTLAVSRPGAHSELSSVLDVVQPGGGFAVNLRHVYFEIRSEHSLPILSTLLCYCPNATVLQVHLVCGEFQEAVQECRNLLAFHGHLERFTFTSEVPSPVQGDPAPPFDFTTYAAVCANVVYDRSTNIWSCFRLCTLTRSDTGRLVLPFQMILVAVVYQDLTLQWIHLASVRHDWNHVRNLCLLLLPKEASIFYAAADATYHDCLRALCTALKNIVELNVSSFHFAAGLDVTALLHDGSLKCLQSLSAPPCLFRRATSLRYLAECCPDFKELDVRFERDGSFSRCLGCEAETCLVTPGGTEFRDCIGPAFPNGLARLTLTEVHDVACLWFIMCCKPTATLRMSYCPLDLDYGPLCDAIANRMGPTCLIFRHQDLRLDDADLLAHLHRFSNLEYLYLLSETPLSESAASDFVTSALESLPQLKCLHAHYRDFTGNAIDKTITWMRRPGAARHEDVVRGGPCFLSCSTATFIGLAKPLNRDTQPKL